MIIIPFGTREDVPKHRFPYVTALIVLLNVLVFAYEIYLLGTFGETQLASFLNTFSVTPDNITDGTPFEAGLLTSMFLHAGFLHIIGNMMFLMPFGDNVEDQLGHLRYIAFYLLCGLAAVLVHVAFNPGSPVPLLGASGAVAGVLGGYLVLHPGGTVRGLFFLFIFFTTIELPAFIFIIGWFILQIFSQVASLSAEVTEGTQVAFLAHIGGFIAGLILAPLLRQKQSPVTIAE
jgi:membrane associated rhomboid family serine protease